MRDARVGQGARSRPSTPNLDGVLEWLQAWLLALRAPGPRAIDARRGAVLSRTRAAAGGESARRPAAGEALPGVVVNRARRTAFASFVSLQLELDRYHVSELSHGGVRTGTRPRRSRYARPSEQYAFRGCFDGVRARGQQTALRETCGSVLSTARPIEPWTKSETLPETL